MVQRVVNVRYVVATGCLHGRGFDTFTILLQAAGLARCWLKDSLASHTRSSIAQGSGLHTGLCCGIGCIHSLEAVKYELASVSKHTLSNVLNDQVALALSL